MPSVTEVADNARQVGSACVDRAGSSTHRMRVVGNVPAGRGTRLDCDNPLRAVCRVPGCSEVQFWRCDTYGCATCGELKRRRLARIVDNGAAIHLRNGMTGYFLTLTAPGSSTHRRWFQGAQPRTRPICECHDHGMTDGLWNAQESACWNRLRTAMTRDRDVIFIGAVETQKRGLLHRHVMVFVEGVLTHSEAQELALAAGYGCVLDLEPVRSSEKAARYISKYVTKASGDRAVIPWERLDFTTGEVSGKRATYRLWSSSRKWGVTMKELKAAQAAQSRARARYLAELVEALAADGEARALEQPGTEVSSDPP